MLVMNHNWPCSWIYKRVNFKVPFNTWLRFSSSICHKHKRKSCFLPQVTRCGKLIPPDTLADVCNAMKWRRWDEEFLPLSALSSLFAQHILRLQTLLVISSLHVFIVSASESKRLGGARWPELHSGVEILCIFIEP